VAVPCWQDAGMDIAGKVVVVTGGGGGIGAGLVAAFAAAGAQAVAVADIDAAAAEEMAGRAAAGSTAQVLARGLDVGDEAAVRSLVEEVEAGFGRIDLFCANAGIMVAGGVEVPDQDWDRIWRVNVKSHLYAARAALPGMLARGEGYLLHTASAAGLLTQLGAAPYAVTKHAVVALAEWLAITYGDRGIRVSCLCPQAVETAMTGPLTQRRASDPALAAAAGTAATDGVLQPADVARTVLETLAEERFLVLPHPEVSTYEQRRAGDRDRWLRGMRRAQQAITDALAETGRA
jgi:NAD(P)-dependent dehydrogenase (short-subunit alcohol dehydrogenase family)